MIKITQKNTPAIIFFIILIAAILRFYKYTDRWGLAYDQAHDALLAIYAIEHFKLPLLGPFSSAGPFQTGGEWYWIVMIGTALFPFTVLGPWIFITLLYVVFVFLMMLVAKSIGGKIFALIAGLFTAVSTAQITQGTNLTNQSPLAIISLLAIWCGIVYIKKQSIKYLFLLGLCIGTASSIHLSGVGLSLFALALFIIQRKVALKGLILLLLGMSIPWLPVFFVDIQHNFTNVKSMFQYYLHDQYSIPLEALGRRWLTYLGVFWPKEWGHVIGGISAMGYLEMALVFLAIFLRKTFKKEIIILMLSILFMILLLRYIHTPLFSSYLVFVHPFILLLTAWVVYILIQKKKLLGLFVLTLIVGGSLYKDYVELKGASNSSNIMVHAQVDALKKNMETKKFAVYTYKEKWKEKNYILALYLEKENRLDPSGFRIGTVIATRAAEFNRPIIWGTQIGYKLIDINASSAAQLKKHSWRYLDAEEVYMSTEEWHNLPKQGIAEN